MNSKIINGLFLLTGAGIGSFVTWRLVKGKYEKLAVDEIKEIRDYYNERLESLRKELGVLIPEDKNNVVIEAASSKVPEKPSTLANYCNLVSNCGYDKKEDKESKVAPHEIPYDIFGEDENYETETLVYYADDILADYDDEEIEDVDGLVGIGNLNTLKEGVTDSIYIQNDETRSYYEILRSEKSYEEDVLPYKED